MSEGSATAYPAGARKCSSSMKRGATLGLPKVQQLGLEMGASVGRRSGQGTANPSLAAIARPAARPAPC